MIAFNGVLVAHVGEEFGFRLIGGVRAGDRRREPQILGVLAGDSAAAATNDHDKTDINQQHDGADDAGDDDLVMPDFMQDFGHVVVNLENGDDSLGALGIEQRQIAFDDIPAADAAFERIEMVLAHGGAGDPADACSRKTRVVFLDLADVFVVGRIDDAGAQIVDRHLDDRRALDQAPHVAIESLDLGTGAQRL